MLTEGQNKRIYTSSDAYMIEQAAICKALLVANITDFKKFDASFNENFIDSFNAIILTAFTIVKDSTAITSQIEKTQKIQELLKEGQNHYKDIMYFVKKKAFKGNKLIANEFGQAEYKRVKTKQADFALFLETLYQTATKYEADLVNIGYSEDLIQGIKSLSIRLHEENTDQEMLKRNRALMTFERIETLNICYEKIALVYEAAQQIYRNDLLKKSLFRFKSNLNKDKIERGSNEIGG